MEIQEAVKLLSEVARARAIVEANPGRDSGYQTKTAEEALARLVAELADAARGKPQKDYNLESAYQSLRTKDEQIRGLRAELEVLRSAVPDDAPPAMTPAADDAEAVAAAPPVEASKPAPSEDEIAF